MLKASVAFVAAIAIGQVGDVYAQADVKGANNYLCYLVEGIKAGGNAPGAMRLRDQFGGHRGTIGKPRMLCNPVDVSGKIVPTSRAHLMCYEASTGDQKPREVMVATASEKLHLVLNGTQLLCVPARKKLVN